MAYIYDPIKNSITVKQKDSINLSMTFSSNGAAIDLTNKTVIFIAKENLNSDKRIIYKEITEHTDPQNGMTTISLSSNDLDIPEFRYYFAILIATIVDGEYTVVDTILPASNKNYGSFIVAKGIL